MKQSQPKQPQLLIEMIISQINQIQEIVQIGSQIQTLQLYVTWYKIMFISGLPKNGHQKQIQLLIQRQSRTSLRFQDNKEYQRIPFDTYLKNIYKCVINVQIQLGENFNEKSNKKNISVTSRRESQIFYKFQQIIIIEFFLTALYQGIQLFLILIFLQQSIINKGIHFKGFLRLFLMQQKRNYQTKK
ncbi:hypothetical protein pb186bvf_015036 [Paramecium bursaria]